MSRLNVRFDVFMDKVFVEVVVPTGDVLVHGRTVCMDFRPREDVALEDRADRFVIRMANGADDRAQGALLWK